MIAFLKILRVVLKALFGAIFLFGGINHFRDTLFYAHMMPPWLPFPLELIYISGIAEVVLGVLFLIPRCTRGAAWGLIVLLIAVFPANLHMALHTELYPDFNPMGLWIRLPLQGVLIAWALAYAMKPSDVLKSS